MNAVILLVFPLLMAFAASSDLLTMRISNRLVLLIAANFFAVALLVVHLPLNLVLMHVGCATLVLSVAFFLFAMGWIGGGDAKLAAATTLWMGFGMTLPYLVYTALFGGVLTLMLLAVRRLPLNPLFARYRWIERLHDAKGGIPYGIALAVAGLVVYSQTALYQALAA